MAADVIIESQLAKKVFLPQVLLSDLILQTAEQKSCQNFYDAAVEESSCCLRGCAGWARCRGTPCARSRCHSSARSTSERQPCSGQGEKHQDCHQLHGHRLLLEPTFQSFTWLLRGRPGFTARLLLQRAGWLGCLSAQPPKREKVEI